MLLTKVRLTSVVGIVAAVVALATTSCGGAEESASASGLEKTAIDVGIMPITEAAPLKLAIDKGLFRDEGLTVKTRMLASGADSITMLKGGSLDLSFGNYVSFFKAHAEGVLKVRVVAEATVNAPNAIALVVPKDSPIKTPKDIEGKIIGVNAKRNIATLLARAGLRPYQVEVDEDKSFKEAPFPNHEQLLKNGSFDASMVAEPFVTDLQREIGARVLIDTSQGPTESFPIAGYATTEEFVQANPKTVAAFQRAILKAQAMVADRKVLEAVIPTFTKIDPDTAKVLHYETYPTSLNAIRLQRVADMMWEFGYLSDRLQVKPLLYATPT